MPSAGVEAYRLFRLSIDLARARGNLVTGLEASLDCSWLADWMASRLSGWLAVWLAGWLADWLDGVLDSEAPLGLLQVEIAKVVVLDHFEADPAQGVFGVLAVHCLCVLSRACFWFVLNRSGFENVVFR